MEPVNFNHSTCPKCSAAMDSSSKTCSKCGAVSLFFLLATRAITFYN